jgi:retinol dehydrogenase-12
MPKPIEADLSGRTCVVTGATSGLGRETAGALARLGATVVMVARDKERGAATRDAIAQESPRARVDLVLADLSDVAQVRRAADEILSRHPVIDVLVNNAGTWANRRELTAAGFERTFATNVLAYFVMTEALLPALRKAPAARIVNVASRLAHGLDASDLHFARRPYSGVTAYAQSKQANRMLTWALVPRLSGTAITANAVHPGGVNTPLFAKGGGILGRIADLYAKLAGKTVEQGADSIVWLAASKEAGALQGAFVSDRRVRDCAYRDPGASEALWDLCVSMTGDGTPTRVLT